MAQQLIYPTNQTTKHTIKMILSTVLIVLILLPFMLGTVHKFKKTLQFVLNDDFVPCYNDWCLNGGIQLSNWGFEIGDGSQYSYQQKGWGNNELQCYTDKYQNVHVEPNPEKKGDGMLVISSVYDANATSCQWTSARIVTKGKKSISWKKDKYNLFCVSARIEARIKIPLHSGAWQAFWMLPEPPSGNRSCLGCGVYGGWCNSGEIDIMEHRDTENKVIGVVRYNDTKGCSNGPQYSQPLNMDKWHIYSIEWTCKHIKWYIDGVLFHTHNAVFADNEPFNQPFYMILNQAIGGDFPNSKVEHVNSKMYVDWVKAYYV
jgi:hypothetical protein